MKLRAELGRPLSSYSLSEILDLLSGWRPPIQGFDHGARAWKTWADYFRAYDQVCEELVAKWPTTHKPFPDQLREEAREHPGEVYEVHVHASLLHSHFYVFRDEHVHVARDVGGDLGSAVEVREASVWPEVVTM